MSQQDYYRAPQSSQRQLEDILMDPNANWSEIRSAMKAHSRTACTNAALMRAIASGMSTPMVTDKSNTSNAVLSAPIISKAAETEIDVESSKVSQELLNNVLVQDDNEIDRGANHTFHVDCIPTADCIKIESPLLDQSYVPNDVMESSSKGNDLTAVSKTDYQIDHEVESEQSRKQTFERCNSYNSEFSFESNGFMGWNHDDKSLPSTPDSNMTNLSSLVNSEGFMDWNISLRKRNLNLSESDEIMQLINDDGLDDFNTKLSSEPTPCSVKPSRICIDNDNRSSSNSHSKTSNELRPKFSIFLSEGATCVSGSKKVRDGIHLHRKDPFWKKYVPASHEELHHEASSQDMEASQLAEIKKALMNVRKSAQDELNGRATTDVDTQSNNQRSNLFHNVSSFLNVTAPDKMSNVEAPERVGMSQNANAAHSIFYNTNKINEKRQNKKISGITSFLEAKKGHNSSLGCIDKKETRRTSTILAFSRSCPSDTSREAIWISSQDGGADIEEEYRKLYSESDCHPPKQFTRGVNNLRASIFGGEIPHLNLKRDENY